MFNHAFFPDEEEELGAAGRRQMHLILGRREDGSIRTLRIQGALSDALAWVGAEDLVQDIRDVREGRASLADKAKEAIGAAPSKLVQSMRPFVRSAAEVTAKQSFYPHITKPRPVRDRLEHAARLFSLDKLYRRFSGKPGRGKDVFDKVLHDAAATVIYSSDPGESAYYDTRALVYKYKEKKGETGGGARPTDRANALYYYRQALKFGDGPAAYRYLNKYVELGGSLRGLRQSIKRAHPLGPLAKKDRMRFVYSLSPKERATLTRAINWYNQTYRARR
jgi:TPR repeat protein